MKQAPSVFDETTGTVPAPERMTPSSADAPGVCARAPDFDSGHFRSALGQFATGVTIITARVVGKNGAPRPIGFTANSFNSVSLEPPLVLWSLSRRAASLPTFLDHARYAVNVLASDQIALSRRFGGRIDAATAIVDRFDGIAWHEGSHGAPIIDGCCAWFECFNRSRYEDGDHVIFVGEVERCGFAAREPLIFQGGGYHMTQPHPDR
jgi:flavin reductase (DIM6/NTAB) family NADH-FMN oxidoreductase RutF